MRTLIGSWSVFPGIQLIWMTQVYLMTIFGGIDTGDTTDPEDTDPDDIDMDDPELTIQIPMTRILMIPILMLLMIPMIWIAILNWIWITDYRLCRHVPHFRWFDEFGKFAQFNRVIRPHPS